MRHRTRPVPVSSRGPEGTPGATSRVAPNELSKPILVSRGVGKIFKGSVSGSPDSFIQPPPPIPHARDRAFDMARQDPPPGVSPQAAAVAILEVLDAIGDTCPECQPGGPF
jgi:hypothetical protein